MGLNIERVTSFIAYWLSVALAAFGAMTPQDFAAYFGVLGVIMTVGINWYYRHKNYALLARQLKQPDFSTKGVNNVLDR